jgi:hypothetical protein
MVSGSETYEDKPRWMDNSRKRVKIVEMYYRKSDDWWYACFTRGGYCEKPKVSPFKNEEGETEHAYEFASLFVDREGGRYGSLRQVLDVQDEINKRRSKALHLMSVRQVAYFRGAVDDVNKLRSELAKPDGAIELNQPMNESFEVLKTGDMAAAQFNLLTEAKMEMDAVGANAATQGKDKTVQSGVALRQRAMTGQTELAPMFDVLKNLDLRVYRKVWNRIKQYWKAPMWLRVTDDENNLKFVGLNQQMTDPMTGQPMMENDLSVLDVDIIMDDAPDTVTQEVEDFQAMAEMVKSGFPLPPEAVIMSSPLSNKDKIIKMMKEQPQLPKEHMEQMQKMQEEMKRMAEENMAMKQDRQIEAATLQQKTANSQAELQLKAQVQAEELRLERERVEAEIQLERAKAAAQLEIKQADMQMQGQQKQQEMEFDMACRKQDQDFKVQEKQREDQETAMPQFLEALKAMMEGFQGMLQQQQQFQATLVAELQKPKTVQLGTIKRNDDGLLMGASATVN